MAKKDVHTTPNPNGKGWVNRVGGQPTGVKHRTQEAAAEAGSKAARENKSEHFIHGRDGQVREKNSYGSDKFPPKG